MRSDLDTADVTQTTVMRLQHMLQKIDRLCLPPMSRRDLESILVRQVANELDLLLPWQAGHGQETALIALQIGRALHLTDEELHQLKLASLLHDIGILMLPPCLHTRREWLEPDTYVTVQNHPRLGAMLLEPFSFLREATVMMAHHHERWDGSGYPYGLRGQFIPLGARILAVADAFEAIEVPHVHDRSLRDRVALRILQVASGTQFDPDVVHILVELSEEAEMVCAREAPYQ
ncbi:MAG: HD domain-containing protein [Nitrospira sp.]|nr:HD domain-containing protein [Nitrospira sp.]